MICIYEKVSADTDKACRILAGLDKPYLLSGRLAAEYRKCIGWLPYMETGEVEIASDRAIRKYEIMTDNIAWLHDDSVPYLCIHITTNPQKAEKTDIITSVLYFRYMPKPVKKR